MLNRTETVKNKIVDYVTNKERLLNAQPRESKDRQHLMRIAYANRRRIKFVISPLL